jgi:hypothetical protein
MNNKRKMLPIVIILIGASVIAACGSAATSTTNTSAPVAAGTNAPIGATTSVPVVVSPAPTATASPKPIVAKPPVLTIAECVLLSMDDIGTVLGGAVVKAREELQSMPGASNTNTMCVYQTNNVKLELIFIDYGPGSSDEAMQIYRKVYPDAVTLPGLGDDAFEVNISGFIQLFVRKANSVNSIGLRSVSSAGDSDTSPSTAHEMEKALADLLLSQLP